MHKFLKGIKNKKEQLRPEALSFFIWKNVDEADRIITCFFYTAYFFPVTLLITQHSLPNGLVLFSASLFSPFWMAGSEQVAHLCQSQIRLVKVGESVVASKRKRVEVFIEEGRK